MQLAQYQAEFIKAMQGDRIAEKTIAKTICGDAISAAERLQIYQDQIAAGYHNALAEIYTKSRGVLGDARFAAIVKSYIDLYPAQQIDLACYGGDFSDFIKMQQDLIRGLPFLSDLAAVEWLWHRAFYAKDAQHFDVTRLSALSDQQQQQCSFTLQPSLALYKSNYPVALLWEYGSVDALSADQFEQLFAAKHYYYCIWRAGFTVQLAEISASCYAGLALFAKARPLSEVMGEVATQFSDTDALALLPNVFELGLVADVNVR